MGEPDRFTEQIRQLRAMGKDQRLREATMELSVGTKDARGRVLQEGDEIILTVPGPIYYRVISIAPAVDPLAPANMLIVRVAAAIPFAAARGAVNPEFVRVRTAEEAGPLPFSLRPTASMTAERPADDPRHNAVGNKVVPDGEGSER